MMESNQPNYPSDLRLLVWKKCWDEFLIQLPQEELTCTTWRVLFSDLLFVEETKAPDRVMMAFIDAAADSDFFLLWNGTTALHDAIEGAVSLPVLKRLVNTCPCTVAHFDFEYQSPLDVVCRKIIMREERQKYARMREDGGDILWECARIMLVGLLTGQPCDEPTLHCLIYASSECPEALRARGIEKFSSQLTLRDSKGDMPIHIAAGIIPHESDVDNLLQLVQMEPSTVMEPNSSNLTPLQIAVDSGRGWKTGISFLIQAAPQSIEILDLEWALYPFLLKNCDENTVYQILCGKPSILRR